MSNSRPNVWVVLRAHFLAQPRQTAVLLVLFAVMIVVYARWFLKDGGTALAGATQVAVTTAPTPPPAAPPEERFQPRRPLVRELARDPFLLQLDRYAEDPDAARQNQAADPAAPAERVECELQLQGTLCGPLKVAWINGRCVHVGEQIEGYVLTGIEPTQATLMRDGVRRVISMD